MTTLSYPRGIRTDPLVGVVTNQPPGGVWAPRGRLEAFVPPQKVLTHYTLAQVSHSIGEFPTYVEARDAILDWWASAGEFPGWTSPKIQYNSSKCTDYWEVTNSRTENLREWWEFLPISATAPHGPKQEPGYWMKQIDRKSRSWWGRFRGFNIQIDPRRFETPPDADGNWPPRGPIPQ